MKAIDNFFWSLRPGGEGFPHPSQQLKQWVAAGQLDRVYEAALRLERGPLAAKLHHIQAVKAEVWLRRTLFHEIQSLLAWKPGLENVLAFLKLSDIQRVLTLPTNASRDYSRNDAELAKMLIIGQSAETLQSVFAHMPEITNCDALLACLVQEMVLRGIVVIGMPAGEFYDARIMPSSHPMAWLPVALLPCEQTLIDSLQSRNQCESMLISFHKNAEAHPVMRLNLTRAKSAVLDWERFSNGICEVKAFDFAEPILDGQVSPQTLLGLRLDCLFETSEADFCLQPIAMSEALVTLFRAAALGGAYDGGQGGAYARWSAWQSVAGLIGAGTSANLDEVAARAAECRWFLFSAKSAWFFGSAWDIGLVVLHPDRRRLVVFAATDTD